MKRFFLFASGTALAAFVMCVIMVLAMAITRTPTNYDYNAASQVKLGPVTKGYVIKRAWERGVWVLYVEAKGTPATWIEVPQAIFNMAESGCPCHWTTDPNDFNGTTTRLVFLSGSVNAAAVTARAEGR